MKIACLSGKGGAGKTFAAVNLAAAAGECCYVDCDVEEPNGRLFLKPEGLEAFSVSTLLPDFDASLCTGCKKCNLPVRRCIRRTASSIYPDRSSDTVLLPVWFHS